jgi:hypothetical protein
VPGPLTVELRFNGRTANRFVLADAEWHPVRIPIPSGSARFYPVELVVTGALPAGRDPRTDAGVRMTWIRDVGERAGAASSSGGK